MNALKLSIILPCYNVERYIAECLDSLYAQDIPETEYEVICVNDCSPDNSRNIILDYQKKHPNLILIEHEVNKRQGGARNTGLKAAKGEYVWFVDPDDFVKENCFSELFSICSINKLDTLLFNFNRIDVESKFIDKNNFSVASQAFDGLSYIRNIWGLNFLNSYDGSVWNRIYRKDFLIGKTIFFPENMYWEDFDHSLKTILFAESILSVNEAYYNYRVNPVSVMSTLKDNTNMVALYDSTVRLGNILIKFSSEIKDFESEISNKIKDGGIWRMNKFVRQLSKTNFKNKLRFQSLAKSDRQNIDYHHLKITQRYLLKYKVALFVIEILSIFRRLFKK